MRKLAVLLLALALLAGCSANREEAILLPTPEPADDTLSSDNVPEPPVESIAPPEPAPVVTPAPTPSPEPSPEPTPELTRAQLLLAEMTLEEKVGQMFLAHCPSGSPADEAAKYYIGGYLFFASYFKDKDTEAAAAGIANIQSAQSIPMLMAVDEEGGWVNRISCYPQYRESIFSSGRKLYNMGGLELIASDAQEKAALLDSLGINLNLAPVCDLAGDPDDFMYNRSYGADAQLTSDCVSAVVTAMADSGVASSLKHFPGYGPNGDTHTDIVYDERDYETFVNADFLPFAAGIEAGAQSVMVCHNVVRCIDPEKPASLSPEVHKILREELGFDGVIITDDVTMSAITKFTDGQEAAILAVEAGNDLICCSDYKTQIPAVIDAVNSGRIGEERINESVLRILELKISIGLIE